MKQKLTVEDVCSAFYFYYHKIVRGTYVKRTGVHYEKAMNDPKMVLAFTKVAKFLMDYNYDLDDYVANTFNHYNKYVHPKTLINLGNIKRYSIVLDERNSTKRYHNIYNKIMKSIRFVALICKTNDYDNVNQFFKHCLVNDSLGTYFITGKISKYYLAMFNNIEDVINKTSGSTYDELHHNVIEHKGQLDAEARKSIKEVNGQEKISIIKVTNYNIQKNIGE